MRSWAVGRASLCILLTCFLSRSRAVPGFAGGVTQAAGLIYDDAELDTVVMGLSVIDIADSTYRGPADADIELRDDVNGFFAISISSYQVSLIVNAVLTAGEYDITIALLNSGSDVATVAVHITVRQSNFPPVFSSSHYFAAVAEDLLDGDVAISFIQATDFDPGTNGVFEYYFADAVDRPFDIDASTGIITLAGTLDFDSGPTGYSFNIVARETVNSDMLSATASVQVFVINVNEHQPTFPESPTLYEYTVSENSDAALLTTADGATTTITAIDGDAGAFGSVTYVLLGTGAGTLFDVEVTTSGGAAMAQLKTLGSLDREAGKTYQLSLTARDGATPPLADTVQLLVTVEDQNDIAPVFTVASYQFSLTEGVDYTSFVIFHATDGDAESPNNVVTYPEITRTDSGGGGNNPFTLDSSTGAVSVTGANLDHETDTSYTLSITARDGGGSNAMEAQATLTITVLAVNEHSPEFAMLMYEATVPENHGVGADIGVTVSASDDLEGHEIEYSINNAFADGDFFDVGLSTGAISLARSLDRDPPNGHQEFTFFVVATDVPPEGQVRLTGQVQVVVMVTDVNDNRPVITSPGHSPFNIELMEVSEPTFGNALFDMAATDIDEESDGDDIVFSLAATDNSLMFFSLNAADGDFMQTAQLDREGCNPVPCSYQMTATACDQATTPMCSSVIVTITVLDVNDNPPVIVNSPLTTTVGILECQVSAMLLETVSAEDTVDTGDFAEVAYEVVSGDTAYFILNEGTGEVSLGFQTLDYESGPRSFSLTVQARDNPDGMLSERLTSADMFVTTINVEDCNDEPPVFSPTVYAFSLDENTPAGTTLSGPTINTDDADMTADNRAVIYRLTDQGTDSLSWFDVNPSTGAIFIRDEQTVDRENTNLLIDNDGRGVLTLYIEAVNTAPTGTLTSTQNAEVVVRVQDQNDNPPIMDAVPTSGSESITLLESIPQNTIIAVVRATDADVGNNAHIAYAITSGNDLGKFGINGATGVVTLVQEIDFEVDPRSYMITITATNDLAASPPPDTDQDEITLTITVEGTNEHAPQFDQTRYDQSVFEYDVLATSARYAIGDVIATVSATDPDSDHDDANHDDIEYSITTGNEDGIFDIIDPTVGNIALAKPEMLDYETTTSYTLLITATDTILPISERKINTTYLFIEVTDENDNVPQFSSPTYTGFVNEEEPTGTNVILVTPIQAVDADSLGGTETLSFEIPTSTEEPTPQPFLAFSISSDGTSLTTTVPIDREDSGNTFTFQIRAIDSDQHISTAMVTIDIMDINDNPPVIAETPAELFITIPENHPVGSVIARITAEDADLDTNAEFIFVLHMGVGYFEIGVNSGVIILETSVQALEPPHMFPLTVYSIDTGNLNSSVTFLVNLTFSNDHPPIFNPTLYFGSVAECAENGSDIMPVITVSATDADSNSMVRYYLESSPIGQVFRLDDRSGVADLLANGNGVYDRETADTLVFEVFATDSTLGTDDDSASVTITIIDCNDNNPIFTQEFYEVDVYESTVSGTTVIQVHTNDADVGENAEVRFRVDSVDPPSLTDVFQIDPESGGIITNVDITNEYTGTSTCSSLTVQTNNITLRIEATDQATLQPQLSNYTTVYIRLLDRNSDAPSFQPSNFYSFSISENIDNVELGTVLATDECDQNSVVTYNLVSSDDSNPFEIDPNTGVIRLVSSLDRESNDLLVIQLEAIDDGTDPGPQTGYASISVTVLDENDNAPQLVEDTYELTRPENIPVGTTLITLSAMDPDLGENSTLNYRILSGDTRLFMLEGPDGSNDHLVTISELDREATVKYVVQLIVEDSGNPMKNDMAVMNLTLSDVNDNEPVWTAGYGTTFDIAENANSMVVVDLEAEDADEGINSELVYFFVGNSQDSGPFHIDRENGTLYLIGELDHEITTGYSLSIAVADRNGAVGDLSVQQNTTTVTINVVDINDNLPYFTKCPHEFRISEDLPEGSVVGGEMIPSVNDLDTIEKPFYFYMANGEDVECYMSFCINENTGVITLDGDIDFEVIPMYTFYVVVSDRPNLTPEEAHSRSSITIDLCDTVATQNNNVTRVDVLLTDINDQPPQFVTDSLLAAVAEEADFDTTVTILRATDDDINATFSTIFYEIIAVDPPYLVDRETGEVTTADVFTGRSGEVDQFTVVAYDNMGNAPTFTATAILTVRVFKQCQQIVAVVDLTKENAENCRQQLEDAVANETDYIIYTTKIRVFQDTDLVAVDTTKSDVIFYALDRTTGEVVEPQEVINTIERALDLTEEPITTVFQNCVVQEVKTFCSDGAQGSTSQSISVVIGIVIGILGAIILALLCCLLCMCALERRKARKLRVKKKQSYEQSSQFSQFSQYATSNPMWMPPYEQWEEESTTTANQSTAMDRNNPLYESQELTIEMFQDDEEDLLSIASSRGNLSKIKPPNLTSTPGGHDSYYDDHDPLAEALGITGKTEDSKTSLI